MFVKAAAVGAVGTPVRAALLIVGPTVVGRTFPVPETVYPVAQEDPVDNGMPAAGYGMVVIPTPLQGEGADQVKDPPCELTKAIDTHTIVVGTTGGVEDHPPEGTTPVFVAKFHEPPTGVTGAEPEA